jgi:hypothetical protein
MFIAGNRLSLRAAIAGALIAFTSAAFAGYADGRKAFDEGDFPKVIENLEPLAENGDGLAQAFVGLVYDGGSELHDATKATFWLVRAAQSDAIVNGKIKAFDCGDNCYLTIATKSGDEVGLCVAPECEPWNADAVIPDKLIGRAVEATIGIGERYDGSGTFMDHALSFRRVSIKK